MNQRFTSYERSSVASLDYAVNRSYSSGQGRFTSVDPIGFDASELENPQSLNLFAYVENNPVDYVDPSGLDLTHEDGHGGWVVEVPINIDPFDTDEWRTFEGHANEFRRTLPMPEFSGGQTWTVEVTADPDPVTTTTGSVSASVQQRSDCEDFVLSLSHLTERYRDSIAARAKIAYDLTNWGYNYWKFIPSNTPVSGFKSILTMGLQESDVYRHVTFSAASYLGDGSGISWMILDDYRNLKNSKDPNRTEQRRQEARASLAGNTAGRIVGINITKRIKGTLSKERLRTKLFNTLCVKVEWK
jgi:RHS repeat-associated protein